MYLLKVQRPDSAPPGTDKHPCGEVRVETVGEFETVEEALDAAMDHRVDETTAVIEDTVGHQQRCVMEWRDTGQLT